MCQVYLISDLHFGHKRITDFKAKVRSGSNYIENMNNIITNWNKIITKRDLVWVLGDVAFNKEGYDALAQLNGRKKLVRGNHDNHFSTEEWLKYFESVESMVRYKDCWLTHCPIHPDELRGRINIHGHVHTNTIPDQRYINVCCEAINETPILFTDLMELI